MRTYFLKTESLIEMQSQPVASDSLLAAVLSGPLHRRQDPLKHSFIICTEKQLLLWMLRQTRKIKFLFIRATDT